MPWCDECQRFSNPNTLTATGECPGCGREISEAGGAHAPEKAPWHFKLLFAAVIVYLGWRAIQLVVWLVT